MRKTVVASTVLIVARLLAVYIYPALPERIAIPWNLSGEVDGYGSRLIWLLLVPLVWTLLLTLLLALPRIDASGESNASPGATTDSY